LRHLRTCNDKKAHAAYKNSQEQQVKAKETAEKKARAQHSARAMAVFNFSGGGSHQLWLLEAEQLRKLCDREGLPTKGSREDLIGRLSEKLSKQRGGALEDLPRNLHALSDSQLAGVCAAHRLKGLKSREEQLEALESLAIGDLEDMPKAIQAGQSSKTMAALKDTVSRKESSGGVKRKQSGEEAKKGSPVKPKFKAKSKVKAPSSKSG